MKKEEALKRKEELKKEVSDLYTDILKEMCNKKDYLNDDFWKKVNRNLNKSANQYSYNSYEYEFLFARLDYEFKNKEKLKGLSEEELNKIITERREEFDEQTNSLRKMLERHSKLKYDLAFGIDELIDMEMEFDGDIIITDPCYIMRKDSSDYECEICEPRTDINRYGFTKYMTRNTLCGDWGCTTYDLDTKKEIGSFCADGGMVSVFLLDEVMKYNPDYKDVENNSWCVTCIRDFKGTVEFRVEHYEGIYEDTTKYHKAGDKWENNEVKVYGHGINKVTGKPINFVGTQTEL